MMGGGASKHYDLPPASALVSSDENSDSDNSSDCGLEHKASYAPRYRPPPPRQLPQDPLLAAHSAIGALGELEQRTTTPVKPPLLHNDNANESSGSEDEGSSQKRRSPVQRTLSYQQRMQAAGGSTTPLSKHSKNSDWEMDSDSDSDNGGGEEEGSSQRAVDVYDWTQFDTKDGLGSAQAYPKPSTNDVPAAKSHEHVRTEQLTPVREIETSRETGVPPRQPTTATPVPLYSTLGARPPATPPPPPAGKITSSPHRIVRPPQLITQTVHSARGRAESGSPSMVPRPTNASPSQRLTGSPTVRVVPATAPGTIRPRSKSTDDHTVKDTKDIVCKKANLPELQHQRPTKGTWLSKRHLVNNYILLELLGSGSYGQVRLCKHKETDALHAIKIISKELLKKRKAGQESTYFDDVKREIAIMKKLDHPNVVKLFEVMDDPKVNKLYLVLEYMKRKDLMQLLKKRQQIAAQESAAADQINADATTDASPVQQIPPRRIVPTPWFNDNEVLKVFQQVVAGLHYLHTQNVIHGDIKPQNLLMDEDSTVKIADFGISKMLDTSTDQLSDTAGTPVFMAPEVCRGEAYSGQLADMWALGATMYMLRMGHPPFVASNATALYYKIENDPITFPQPISSGLHDVLVHLLEKDPAKRWGLDQLMTHPWIISGENSTVETMQCRIGNSGKTAYATIQVTHDEVYSSINQLEEMMGTRKEYEYASENAEGGATTFYTTERMGGNRAISPIISSRNTQSLGSEQPEARGMSSEEESRRLTSFLKMRARGSGQAPKTRIHGKHEKEDEEESRCSNDVGTESDSDGSDGDADNEDNDSVHCHRMRHTARKLSSNDFEAMMDTLAQQPQLSMSRQHHSPLTNCDLDMSLVSVPHQQMNRTTRVGICYRTTKGRRRTQQDRFNAECDLSRLPTISGTFADQTLAAYSQLSAACVFDGHNGEQCAEWLADHALSLLAKHDGFLNAPKPTVAKLIPLIDQQLCALLRNADDTSGSTGIIALYDGRSKTLLVANVGDSRCIVSRNGTAVALSEDHRLTRLSEKERVVAAGAAVAKDRINGVLAVSRSFGDIQFKSSSHATGAGAVIAQPEIKAEIVTPKTEFAVIASDGLWDVMTPQHVVNFVRKQLEEEGDLHCATRAVVAEALSRGSVDNVTVVLMAFHLA